MDGKLQLHLSKETRGSVVRTTTGLFTQEDPIGLAGGLNLYGYAGGDPVNFSDPFGLMECKPPDDPKCKDGPILTATVGVTTAAGSLGFNFQFGAALNLRTGDAAAFAQGGPSMGGGFSKGPSVGVQRGTLADVVAPSPTALAEGGTSVTVSGGATVTVPFDSRGPSGLSIGTRGVGGFWNFSWGGAMSPTVNLYQNRDKSYICAKVGVGCTP